MVFRVALKFVEGSALRDGSMEPVLDAITASLRASSFDRELSDGDSGIVRDGDGAIVGGWWVADGD